MTSCSVSAPCRPPSELSRSYADWTGSQATTRTASRFAVSSSAARCAAVASIAASMASAAVGGNPRATALGKASASRDIVAEWQQSRIVVTFSVRAVRRRCRSLNSSARMPRKSVSVEAAMSNGTMKWRCERLPACWRSCHPGSGIRPPCPE